MVTQRQLTYRLAMARFEQQVLTYRLEQVRRKARETYDRAMQEAWWKKQERTR